MPQLVKTSTTPGTPVALVATDTYCQQAVIFGYKALARTANTGDVYLGLSATASQQPLVLKSEESYLLGGQMKRLNLAELYLDVANSGDGVVVMYYI